MALDTKDVLFEIAKEVGMIYADIENQILQLLTDEFKKLDDPTDLDAKLQKIKLDFLNKCKVLLNQADPKVKAKIAESLVDIQQYSLSDMLKQLKALGIVSVDDPKKDLIEKLLDQNYQNVQQAFRELYNNSLMLKTKLLHSSEKMVGQTIDQIVFNIKTGKVYNNALQEGLNQIAGNGFTFKDAANRIWDPRSYMDMATRTQSKNVNTEVNKQMARELNNDLYIINALNDGCLNCAPWENKIISMNGMTKDYPTYDDALVDGYGHPNCRHTETMYVENLTTGANRSSNATKTNYENTQKQRYLEKMIRNWKQRASVAITDDVKKVANQKIKFWQGTLTKFVKINDLPRLRWREQLMIPIGRSGQLELNYLTKRTGKDALVTQLINQVQKPTGITLHNFQNKTIGTFKKVDTSELNIKQFSHVSNNLWYNKTTNQVARLSNKWGSVKNCDWFLENIDAHNQHINQWGIINLNDLQKKDE